MSRAKTLLESLWIISIIIPPKVRVPRKRRIILLFLESPHHLLVPNRIVRWLVVGATLKKWPPGNTGVTAPRGKRRKDLGNKFWWVGLVRFVWGRMKRSGRFVETTVQVK